MIGNKPIWFPAMNRINRFIGRDFQGPSAMVHPCYTGDISMEYVTNFNLLTSTGYKRYALSIVTDSHGYLGDKGIVCVLDLILRS
jgi:hypothetical protein